MLHGVGRRCATRRVRDAGRADSRDARSRRSKDSTTRRVRRWVDAFTATGASQCGFCTPGHHHAAERTRSTRRGDRRHVRCSRTSADAPAGARSSKPPPATTSSAVVVIWEGAGAAGFDRRRDAPAGRRRSRRRSGAIRRRFGAEGCTRGGASANGTRVGDGSDGARGACGVGKAPRATDDGGPPLAARGARGRLGADAAHDVGRARVPRDRRVVGTSGRRGADPLGERWRVRREGRDARSLRQQRRSRASINAQCACCGRVRTPCAGDRSARRMAIGVRADGTGVARVARTPGHRGRDPLGRTPLDRRGGRRAGPPTSVAAARRGMGGGRGGARCARGSAPKSSHRREHARGQRSTMALSACGWRAARCSTRSCCAATASAPRTWRSGG